MEFSVEEKIGGKTFSIKSGKLAKQASGSVVVQYEDTVVLITVVSANEEKVKGDFIPLTVEYQERIYAAGRIPGNYFRREIGRPSDKEILTARLIDRSIRPLFKKGFAYETQVIATVLSTDRENDPDMLAMVGTSAAILISDIPFDGPIAGVRVARIDGKLVINPKSSEWEKADINIVVTGSRAGIVMVEGGGNEMAEADMLDAIFFGHKAMQPLIDMQIKLQESIGKLKRQFDLNEKDTNLVNIIESNASSIIDVLLIPEKLKRYEAIGKVKKEIIEKLPDEYKDSKDAVSEIFHDLVRKKTRELILSGRRIDGRKFDEIRNIFCEVGLLPRPHGSALFTRGETQVFGVLTLGSGQDELRVETLTGDTSKAFMLHYNFPPFSVGEVRRISGPSRRDIGHGALATRAIEKVLPLSTEFDYTIRLVAEVLESNGSSSMGSVCAGILALMDGGVPISSPVAGIAMGLIKEDDTIIILSDILGDEDHTGDMDFKIAGTRNGVTAVQMDIKIKELSREIMDKALEQAKKGRLFILDKMMAAIGQSRSEISSYAPKVYSVKINPDKIRDVIGPHGKMIKSLQAETNTRIEIDDTGLVKISAENQDEGEVALKMIKAIGLDPEIGEIYDGTVVKVTDFGAFVQIKPGSEGLVHISQLASHHVKKVTEVVNEGDKLLVKVMEIGRDGKIRLSHKATVEDKNDRNRK
ncbi:MAG: polyribonucleotide nucleotidyltransferase [Desulfobacterales bacterium]|nr:polyribonucleotide nucleotidyltransferase [Desulfobacterales bacterium]